MTKQNNDLAGEELLRAWDTIKPSGITQEKHAAELGVPYEIYKARYYRAMDNRRFARMLDSQLDKPELFKADEYKPLEFQFGSFLAVCDIHAPCTDYDFAMLPAMIAKKHLKRGNRVLVVHGDVFDGAASSTWQKIVRDPTWDDERAAAANLFAIWGQVFDKIIIMPGNHDYRLLKRLEGEMSFGNMVWGMVDEKDKNLAHMFGGLFSTGHLTISPVDHCLIDTPQGLYVIAHGSQYSINPLTVANEMAQKYHAHVILGHEHHLGLAMSRFGRYYLINNGGLFDDKKFSYVQLQANKRPAMKTGFTFVRDGFPNVFGAWTDWNKWL